MIAIRHKMILSLSYDHRVVDGALGGMFLRRIADFLKLLKLTAHMTVMNITAPVESGTEDSKSVTTGYSKRLLALNPPIRIFCSHWFHLLVLGRALDDRAPNYLKQAIGWSYHAPYAGHDGIQLAIGQILTGKPTICFLITVICLPVSQVA